MLKTLKVETEFYDKVKALSDASGESLTQASNFVVGAGLGEMKGLGNALKGAKGKVKLSAPNSNEEIVIKNSPSAAAKGKVEQYICVECGYSLSGTEANCPSCNVSLDWQSVGVEAAEAESNNGWILVIGAVIAALALKRRVKRNGVLHVV